MHGGGHQDNNTCFLVNTKEMWTLYFCSLAGGGQTYVSHLQVSKPKFSRIQEINDYSEDTRIAHQQN